MEPYTSKINSQVLLKQAADINFSYLHEWIYKFTHQVPDNAKTKTSASMPETIKGFRTSKLFLNSEYPTEWQNYYPLEI